MTSYTDRYQRLTEQAAYRFRVQYCGLSALLEPYAVRPPVELPRQRTPRRAEVRV